jgi:hypothetical protein
MYSYYNLKNNTGPIKKYKKLIEYASFTEYENCRCQPEIGKSLAANPYASYDSRNLRVSQTINSSRGGRIQFGDNGKPLKLNYLGRLEGSSGGGGVPVKNKF